MSIHSKNPKIPQITNESRSRTVNDETSHQILMMSGKLFAGVRYFFTKYIRAKLNAFFINPMYVIAVSLETPLDF
jgi:hypothetical protein